MFQEKYELVEVQDKLETMTDLLITGCRSDSRSLLVQNTLANFKGLSISLEVDKTHDKLTITGKDKKIGNNILYPPQTMLTGLRRYLKSIRVEQRNVLIDITALQHVILFLLIKILLTEMNPRLLFAAYTEPEEYIREALEPEEFSLSEEFLGLNAVPGFSRRDRGSNKVLVALLGFEGKRLQALLDDIQPPKVVPVVGFPSYSPGWKSTAIMANARSLNAHDCYNELYDSESSSPFKIYKLLAKLSKDYPGHELLIAPLGTRPHALGASIYASLNGNCSLLYDFPIERQHRSKGILKSNVYHLSRYLGA